MACNPVEAMIPFRLYWQLFAYALIRCEELFIHFIAFLFPQLG